MTYSPGDPGHIDVHVDLRATLAAMGATTLPADPSLGDPGHVADHAAIRTALEEIITLWGVDPELVTLPPVPVLGQTDHVADHNAIDAAIAVLYANGYNEATGGTILELLVDGVPTRRHLFTAAGDLEIVRAIRPFGLWLWGAGGGGGSGGSGFIGGPGGGGGYLARPSITFAPGPYAIVTGGGGYGGASWNGGYAWNGGCTSIDHPPTDGGDGAPNGGLGDVILGAGGGNGGRPNGGAYGGATAGVPNPEGNGLQSSYGGYSGDYSAQAVAHGLPAWVSTSSGNAGADGAAGGGGALCLEYAIPSISGDYPSTVDEATLLPTHPPLPPGINPLEVNDE